jgi:hypothetical protein
MKSCTTWPTWPGGTSDIGGGIIILFDLKFADYFFPYFAEIFATKSMRNSMWGASFPLQKFV